MPSGDTVWRIGVKILEPDSTYVEYVGPPGEPKCIIKCFNIDGLMQACI